MSSHAKGKEPEMAPDATMKMVLDRLKRVARRAVGWQACCPAHEDNNPSLSLVVGDDGCVLVHCFAGCTPESIVTALGMAMADLFPGHQRSRRELHVVRPRLKREASPPDPKWQNIAADSYSAGRRRLPWLADNLGVAVQALSDLRVGWLDALQIARLGGTPVEAYTIPERDGFNRVVGLALRRADGSKSFLPGGSRGLAIPASVRSAMPPHVYAVEGMSDCAALLTSDKPAVARASCTSGARELLDLVRNHPQTSVTIVGDRDKPGQAGAIGVQCELQVMLKRPVGLALPPAPHKDMRAALIGGAL